MAAYVVYPGAVYDQDRYDTYKVEAARSIAATGGRYLVRGGEVLVLGGRHRPGGR